MSTLAIRQALESALNAITPTLATAWEGKSFAPTTGTPFQRARMTFLPPDNACLGTSYHQERGALLVELHYPLGVGPAAAGARAELVRAAFKRGNSFIKSGVTVRCPKTPVIGTGIEDTANDEYVIPVTIPFEADIFE